MMYDAAMTEQENAVPTSPGTILQNLNYLHNELDVLHDRISLLTDRLGPILAPAPSGNDVETGQPDANSDLASRVSNAVRMVNAATSRLTSLTDGIDL